MGVPDNPKNVPLLNAPSSRYRTQTVSLQQEFQTSPADPVVELISHLTHVFSAPAESPLRWMLEERSNGKSIVRAFDLTDGFQGRKFTFERHATQAAEFTREGE